MKHEVVETIIGDIPSGVAAILVCSCSWRSLPGGRDEVASQFEEHVTSGEDLRSQFQ